jgi:protein-tyrosine phosphatase
LPEEVKQVLASVEASFLAAAFDAVEAEYGDLDRYFSAGLGVGTAERASLQMRYLEP